MGSYMIIRRALVILSALTVLLIPNLVGAQSAQQTGQGLEISPPLLDIKADPGQSLQTEVRIRNVTKGPLIVKPQVNDFVAAGEDGQPKLLLDDTEESPFSIKKWIVVSNSLRIEPGEQKKYSITLNVPKDAGPGGHYGVVRFTGLPPEIEDTGVSLSASVGTLVLVNVSGNISEQARVSEMYTSKGDKKRSFFEYGPVTVVQKIQNTGNIHFKPKGTVRIVNMLGKETASFQVNDKGGNVLPGSTRKFEQTLDKKFLIGRYKAQADLVYGSDNKIISRTISFWVIPYKLIIIIIGAIALLIFLLRQYNRYIVKKARKQSSSKKDEHNTKKK